MALRTPEITEQGYTAADLDAITDDAHWSELSYGSLIVTPAPANRHQALLVNIAAFLHNHRPASLRVLAEAELLIRPDLVKRPDIQVVDKREIGGARVTGVPLLVVEIHSSSTKVLDLTEKRHVYAQAAVPAYWLVDPTSETVTILELVEGGYVERTVLSGDGEFEVTAPFPMTLRSRTLFD